MSNFSLTPNKAALFFSLALFPAALLTAQSTGNDTVAKEQKIEEVVVIGYGKQKKEAVTGSVASISGSALNEVPASNLTEAVQGRLPGVQIGRSSTKPGAVQQIRIRGTRSLTGSNDPLIVLDGIPFSGSLNDISMDNIKSMDILKDASATAIYGSRGANGVIIITTNRGNKGQKPKFSYNGYTGFQTIFSKYPMMDGPQLLKLRADAGNLYSNGADELDTNNTDWQKEYYGVGIMMNHDIGVTGGTNGGNYSFGVGYFQQNGVVPLQSFKRMSIRATVDQEIGEYFKVGFSSNSNFTTNDFNGVGGAATLGNSPLVSLYNPDGTIRTVANSTIDQGSVNSRMVYESLGDKYADRTRAFSSYNNLYGELRIPGIEGLKYRLNVGLNYRQSNSGSYTGQGVLTTNPENASSAGVGNGLTTHWVLENLLTYDKRIGKHSFNATAMYSSEQSQYNSSYISARDIPLDAFQYFNIGHALGEITVNPEYQGYYKRGLTSLMGRLLYQYDNKYMITATLRSDGSSVLAEGHKWHTYPAVSLGWNIANENFLKDSKIINTLKLRAGYGQTSNQAIGPYQTFGSLSTVPYNFGNDMVIGNYVSLAPNSSLGWEFSKTQNYGVDFTLLNRRLSGTVEYYITKTQDLLLYKGLPESSGLSSVMQNVGSSENKGLEVSLNGTIFDNPDGFTWDAGINWYYNQNKITALASGQTRNEGNNWFVGYNMNSIYEYQYMGLWQDGDPYLSILEPGGNVGMIKVLYTGGYNEDGTPVRAIGPDDRQIIEMDPDWMGGFNTRLAYKSFDLSVVGAFQKGGVLVSTIHGSSGYLNRLTGRGNNIDVDYWTIENPNVRYPKPGGLMSGDNPKYGSTLALFDGSYVKIRTITLGYNFTDDLKNALGLSSVRLYLTVQNPFVFGSPYYRQTGVDPEPNSAGNENQASSGYQSRTLVIGTNNPSTRNYLIGLNLTF